MTTTNNVASPVTNQNDGIQSVNALFTLPNGSPNTQHGNLPPE